MNKRFKYLRTLANIFKILGIILAALSLLGGIVVIVLGTSNGNFWRLFGLSPAVGEETGIAAGIIILVVGILGGLIEYGIGELIFVLLSIEENTYKTSVFLEEIQQDEE
ncbi:MAG: Uncharacterized protein XD73_0942 [Anaerolinea thermophila]|uniref:Uncharacterized protein n=1 Tax=Anaerolinea thermophila TaxID=167964 RepID=A0A101FXH5_9CHLR|nr:MAG: Uncharacterized protein XD73_0942 [Anaerolinea thermophila]